MHSELGCQADTGSISSEDARNLVHRITSGRPVFIIQFAHIWAQTGNLEEALDHASDIGSRADAVEFLFGRIYDYLSPQGKKIFCAISLLVTQHDLTNLVGKLKYIVNLEDNELAFKTGLDDLVKLKVIETFENDFFRVYSAEILRIMQEKYSSMSRGDKRDMNSRLTRITGDRTQTIEEAFLRSANAGRDSGVSQTEVINRYRTLLNRPNNPVNIRSQAILNLAEYIYNNQGDKKGAIDIFEEYWGRFEKLKQDQKIAKMYAHYCWSYGQRERAIEVLTDALESISRDDKAFGLLGLRLIFQSIILIERKEKLRSRLSIGEISKNSFDKENYNIKQDMRNLINRRGNPLFQLASTNGLERLNNDEKQNVVTGLYHFSGICVRLFEFSLAMEVCDFVLGNSLPFLADEFRKRHAYAKKGKSNIRTGKGRTFRRTKK